MNPELFRLHAEVELKHWWFVARRRVVRTLLEAVVPPGRGHLIVDVGCGTGATLGFLGDAYRCVGIDPSPDAIRLAASRFPGARFSRGHAPDDLGDDARDADAVLLLDVLEHVADDFELFSRIAAELKPGAHILLTVPADRSLWSEHDVSFGHFRRYTAPRLREVWRGLPFTERLVSGLNARLYPVVKAVRMLSRVRGTASGRVGTDFRVGPAPVNAALTWIFAGEASRLRRAISNANGASRLVYSRGVSLVALLRREPGEVVPRSLPEALRGEDDG
ncbi:MAG: class I SAM-dependent methyltransferase [Longimicrobiales bacterium]